MYMIEKFALTSEFQLRIFKIVVYVTWILYVVIALGISVSAPKYLDILTFIFRSYISLFLIYRFNPFRKVKFDELDSKIAFSAGLFLAYTLIFKKVLLYLQNPKMSLFSIIDS
jgi:hypothetical protein